MRPLNALLALAALAALTACEPTTLRFENQVPGAQIDNLRWTAEGQTYESPDRLLPGQRSAEVDIMPEQEGARGRVSFELDLDGRRVALEVEAPVKVPGGEATVFVLTPDTAVRSLLLAETPMALWAAPPASE